MITKTEEQIVEDIKSVNWVILVQRPGFLQAKMIIQEAETTPIVITPGITIALDNLLWVKESDIFDKDQLKIFDGYFEKAFIKNPLWPIAIADQFDEAVSSAKKFCQSIQNNSVPNGLEDKMVLFKQYEQHLIGVQRFYVLADSLPDYAEAKLSKLHPELLEQGYSYRRLDIMNMTESLRHIQNLKTNHHDVSQAINDHIDRYAWVRTGYNMIRPYTKDDVLGELEHNIPALFLPPANENNYLLIGLQVGIYLRNRVKEMSQQLWYVIEPLAQSIARDLSLSRDDFFQMTYQEVIDITSGHTESISDDEIHNRHTAFVCGFIKRQRIILSGLVAQELYDYFNPKITEPMTTLKGNVASKGFVQGKVRVVLDPSQYHNFVAGDVLVASMTTPDYIVLMKKCVAIITDEGGLASHAAIVSRELGIPCIVGTKIGTKVLQDGDTVEVDANKGVVRKL